MMRLAPLERVRNLGIIAHIDAGKTTATERFLYFSGRTYKMGEVHDGAAVMDFRPDERERGITISAAATTFMWNNHQINLIDTPGHVDFTAEVDRSLRVLVGAVVIFSGVEGVEPQSETVWRQADRYRIPRLAFINKLDRAGADHDRVLKQIETRLRARAAFVNIPHGAESALDGVIDVIDHQWLRFDPATLGREIEILPIPETYLEAARAAHARLIEQTAECVDWLAERYLAGDTISADELKQAIREATLAGKLVPVLCGAALRDLGIQPVLDAACAFLPSPLDCPPALGHDPESEAPRQRALTQSAPFSALVFKVVALPSTDIFWLRVYSGSLGSEERCYQPRSKTTLRLRRLMRLHADRTEPVERAECGDIVAVTGLKNVVTGDTLCDPRDPITYEPIQFPQTVVSMAVEARTSADRERVSEVVRRLMREDPTLAVRTDEETGQLILSGMGELHLQVMQNRMQREFGVTAFFGRPQVSYRETPIARSLGSGSFDKRIGDQQVSGRATVEVIPRPRAIGEKGLPPVVVEIVAARGNLPRALHQEVEARILGYCHSGGLGGHPVIDVTLRLREAWTNDPPDPMIPLAACLTLALRDAFHGAQMAVLEPVMNLEVRLPDDCFGAVLKDLLSRRAEIQGTDRTGDFALIRGIVPLAEMFGYSTHVRSITQGRGSFAMEPYDYQKIR
jgi:elongation factor G